MYVSLENTSRKCSVTLFIRFITAIKSLGRYWKPRSLKPDTSPRIRWILIHEKKMSRGTKFSTIFCVHLGWSESCKRFGAFAIHRMPWNDYDKTAQMHGLIWGFAENTRDREGIAVLWLNALTPLSRIFHNFYLICTYYPASILYKSIAGRYRPVSYPDGPIPARYRFTKNAYWDKWYLNVYKRYKYGDTEENVLTPLRDH